MEVEVAWQRWPAEVQGAATDFSGNNSGSAVVPQPMGIHRDGERRSGPAEGIRTAESEREEAVRLSAQSPNRLPTMLRRRSAAMYAGGNAFVVWEAGKTGGGSSGLPHVPTQSCSTARLHDAHACSVSVLAARCAAVLL